MQIVKQAFAAARESPVVKVLNTKKAQANKLVGFVLSIVILAVVTAVGLAILAKLSGVLDAGSAARNAVDEMIDAIAEIPGWVPIIIIAVVGGLVIFLMFRSFQGQQG